MVYIAAKHKGRQYAGSGPKQPRFQPCDDTKNVNNRCDQNHALEGTQTLESYSPISLCLQC